MLRSLSVFACLLAMLMAASAQELTFTTNSFNIDTSCYGITAADVNGDGRPDVVASCINSSTAVILANSGNGQFVSSSIVSNVASPIAAADVNGDGKVDLIWAAIAVKGNPALMIETNNGSGGFSLCSTAPAGVDRGSFAIAAADINGDHKMDLICANGSDDKVYVLTNNGAGVFTLYSTLAVGNNPMSMVVADINNDGKPDIITANLGFFPSFGNTLTVFTNNGSGFGFSATLTVGSAPQSVAAADVNGDGFLDLISANQGSGSLSVLTNNGHGIFHLNATIPDNNAFSVVAADLNGDGKVDLACANDNNNTVTIFTNNGTGVFGSNTTLVASTVAGTFTDFLVAVDLDGDGQMDLVAGNENLGGPVDAFVTVFTQTAIAAPPALSLQGGNAAALGFSWSTPSTTFSLQTNDSLSGTNWAAASFTITTNGQTRTTVINPNPAGNLFFRLKRQ